LKKDGVQYILAKALFALLRSPLQRRFIFHASSAMNYMLENF